LKYTDLSGFIVQAEDPPEMQVLNPGWLKYADPTHLNNYSPFDFLESGGGGGGGGGSTYGKPGEGENGPGLAGVYYDHVSGTYRSTAPGNPELSRAGVTEYFHYLMQPQGGGDVNILSAYWHYKFGGGTDYYVDISKVDWTMLSEKDFPGGVGSIRNINIFNIKPLSTTGAVFGDIRLQYLGNNQIKVAETNVNGEPYFDTYNYNIRWNEVMNGENLKRNIVTGFGWVLTNMPWHPLLFNTYGGKSYKFFFYGTGTIGGGQ